MNKSILFTHSSPLIIIFMRTTHVNVLRERLFAYLPVLLGFTNCCKLLLDFNFFHNDLTKFNYSFTHIFLFHFIRPIFIKVITKSVRPWAAGSATSNAEASVITFRSFPLFLVTKTRLFLYLLKLNKVVLPI